MALQSMTGFARSLGHIDGFSWSWELRSVNAKGMDVRLRLPPGFEGLETKARKCLQRHFRRGTLQVSLSIIQAASNTIAQINHDAVHSLINAARGLQTEIGGNLPTAAELLSIRGVVEFVEPPLDDNMRDERDALLLSSLEEAAEKLLKERINEGRSIVSLLKEQVDAILELHKKIDSNPARTPEAIKKQLEAQVAKVVQSVDTMDEARLYQEVAILAAKADLQEELDRLVVHLGTARDLLKGEGPVGRQLDFIAQEFNRECNTICSKSNSAEVTSLGLDMKLIIDKFREQLQNME